LGAAAVVVVIAVGVLRRHRRGVRRGVVGQGRVALSCHLVVARVERSELLLTDAYTLLGNRHGIDHATIQVEPESLADASPRSVCALACDPHSEVA